MKRKTGRDLIVQEEGFSGDIFSICDVVVSWMWFHEKI